MDPFKVLLNSSIHRIRPSLGEIPVHQELVRLKGEDVPGLREFYSICNGGCFFVTESDISYRVIGINEINPLSTLLEYSSEFIPLGWCGVVESYDSNWVVLNLSRDQFFGSLIDCDIATVHMTGYRRVISLNFNDFIRDMLEGKERPFWLAADFKAIAYV